MPPPPGLSASSGNQQHPSLDVLINQHLQQLQQIIFAKDQELIANKQRLVGQDAEISKLAKQNQTLAQQAQKPQGSSENTQ
jgi:hypothetical protein